MELLKTIKPYLERRYEVVADRADLYAYFFELGVRLLKPGGRLGYISSSSFFRTRSGAPLRAYLSENTQLEAVVDFGDLQVFEGVTTYPVIVVMNKCCPDGNNKNGHASNTVRFLNLKTLPTDLSSAFDDRAQAIPQSRLGRGSWRFESDTLDAVRAKMATVGPQLEQLYGPPLYGIKTGLNDAFVLPREVCDELIARDSRSAEIIKPFLVGENLKRWHAENDDLSLIYTPKSRVDINEYPAVRDHLLQYRTRLENRATKQEWWELQQAQASCQAHFEAGKIVYPEMSQGPKFSIVRGRMYLSNKCFFLPAEDEALVACMGSKPCWLWLFGEASPLRGGQWRLELREQYVSRLPIPAQHHDFNGLTVLGRNIQAAHEALHVLTSKTFHRLGDVAPSIEKITAFRGWTNMDFAALRAAIRRRFRGSDFAVAERDEWEGWYEARRQEACELLRQIVDAEAEINERAYVLYGLTRDEITVVEEALEGQY